MADTTNSYKTPSYIRKASLAYYHRNNGDPEFMEKMRKQKNEQYQKHKDDPAFKAKRREYARKYRAKKKAEALAAV